MWRPTYSILNTYLLQTYLMIFHFLYFCWNDFLYLKLTTPLCTCWNLIHPSIPSFVLSPLWKHFLIILVKMSCLPHSQYFVVFCASILALSAVQLYGTEWAFIASSLSGELPKGTKAMHLAQCLQRRGSVNTGCIEFFIINVVKNLYTLWHSLR